MNIQGVSSVGICSLPCVDEEEREIMRRLLAYGVNPTGNKTADKAKLREIELKKAKESNSILNNLLTVSKSEQEKIQAKKKAKKKEVVPEINVEKFEGSKALGEQKYLAIKMKATTS